MRRTRQVKLGVRAARGLIARVRSWRPRFEGELPGRDLVGRAPKGQAGTCKWCGQETEPRKAWHRDCLYAFLAARGSTVGPGQGSIIPQAPCAECGGPGQEIDHRLALGIAVRLPRRYWVKAWWLGNLQWLCRECHARKSGRDRRIMRLLDALGAPQRGLFGELHFRPEQGDRFGEHRRSGP